MFDTQDSGKLRINTLDNILTDLPDASYSGGLRGVACARLYSEQSGSAVPVSKIFINLFVCSIIII